MSKEKKKILTISTDQTEFPFTKDSWLAYKKYQDEIPGKALYAGEEHWYTFYGYMEFLFNKGGE